MTIGELTYTPTSAGHAGGDEIPHTIVMFVHQDVYEEYKKDKSIPIARVVDSFEVFKYANPGRSGKLEKPSQSELKDVFGFTNETEIAEYMLEHGESSGSFEVHRPDSKWSAHARTHKETR